jgi:hypothetical protein
MDNKFREPVLLDKESGLYITVAQLEFFLNSREGLKQFKTGDPIFLGYYRNCCLYNLIYDMMEEDPGSADMYWDSAKEEVAFSFPVQGRVSKALSEIEYMDDDEEEGEDPWNLFTDG